MMNSYSIESGVTPGHLEMHALLMSPFPEHRSVLTQIKTVIVSLGRGSYGTTIVYVVHHLPKYSYAAHRCVCIHILFIHVVLAVCVLSVSNLIAQWLINVSFQFLYLMPCSISSLPLVNTHDLSILT